MSKNKAALETLIISVLIPLFLWICTRMTLFGAYGGEGLLLFVFLGLSVLYYYVIFTRHKHLGKLFVFLTAVLSTLIQSGVIILEILSLGPVFEKGEGHPNGGAILLLAILIIQPILYDIASLFIWIGIKLFRFFSGDDDTE
ncbi:MAG: hypothetical protein K6E18_05535 [Lachnospiraceae bacterium]|nr:hypothetical protein [Lachnospiraceae bacterium]